MSMTRRDFVTKLALGSAAFGLAPHFVWGAEPAQRRLLFVLLRGAADGLNMVVPYRDRDYQRLRPDLAIEAPGRGTDRAIDLDGQFGLHPALEPLAKLYQQKKLGIVVATGSPSLTRSHFDAQDYLETGTPDVKRTTDGWLNRYLQQQPSSQRKNLRAVALGGSMPRILQGSASVLAVTSTVRLAGRGGRRGRKVEDAFAAMYQQDTGAVGEAGREALAAVEQIRESDSMGDSAQKAEPAGRTVQKLTELGRLAAAEPELEVGFTDIGGWDTHVRQGRGEGPLARNLDELGRGLQRMQEELGDEARRTVVVVMTEFGRTAAQNGNGGTDHGHGSVAFVLGGPVAGGTIYGRWPGLRSQDLHEGRDLAVTTDFRRILAEVLGRHMQAPDPGQIFPDFDTRQQNWLGLIRA